MAERRLDIVEAQNTVVTRAARVHVQRRRRAGAAVGGVGGGTARERLRQCEGARDKRPAAAADGPSDRGAAVEQQQHGRFGVALRPSMALDELADERIGEAVLVNVARLVHRLAAASAGGGGGGRGERHRVSRRLLHQRVRLHESRKLVAPRRHAELGHRAEDLLEAHERAAHAVAGRRPRTRRSGGRRARRRRRRSEAAAADGGRAAAGALRRRRRHTAGALPATRRRGGDRGGGGGGPRRLALRRLPRQRPRRRRRGAPRGAAAAAAAAAARRCCGAS